MSAKRQDTRMGLQSGWTEVTDPIGGSGRPLTTDY